MPWETSNRRDRLPADWETRRRRVLQRDGHQCRAIRADTGRRCEAMATDIDHVKPGGLTGHDDDRLSNLVSLCNWHHGQKSSHEGAEAQRRRKAATRRRHPGLLP